MENPPNRFLEIHRLAAECRATRQTIAKPGRPASRSGVAIWSSDAAAVRAGLIECFNSDATRAGADITMRLDRAGLAVQGSTAAFDVVASQSPRLTDYYGILTTLRASDGQQRLAGYNATVAQVRDRRRNTKQAQAGKAFRDGVEAAEIERSRLVRKDCMAGDVAAGFPHAWNGGLYVPDWPPSHGKEHLADMRHAGMTTFRLFEKIVSD